MDRDERLKRTQQRRAKQFAACAYALDREPSAGGAEALFDQALTNGLALIVSHAWPGEEASANGFMLPASKLLKVIETNGVAADDGVTRVLHDPTQPEFVKSTFWFGPGDEDRLEPNFTEVRGPILKRALEITKEIRHAREVSGQPAEPLADEHLEALKALGDYPEMWHTIHDEALNDYEKQVSASDDAERNRAWRYLELLGEDEAHRRADSSEWADQFSPAPGDPDTTTFEDCPVCGYETLVAPYRDGYLDEVGVGHCFVCSYERTSQVAEEMATGILMRRSVERSD